MSEVNPAPVPTAAAVPASPLHEDAATAAVASAAANAVAQTLPQAQEIGEANAAGGGGPAAAPPLSGGGVKRLHGFSVAEPSIEDAASDAVALSALAVSASPKRGLGKFVSLPGSGAGGEASAAAAAALLSSAQRGGNPNSEKLRAGGMRVVLPEGAAQAAAASPAQQQPPQARVQGSPSPGAPLHVVVQHSAPGVVVVDRRPLAATTAQSPLRDSPAVTAVQSPPPHHSASGLPSVPGRVVEPGQEHTGRWTKEEHEAFLSALQTFGKEWKKVAARVKTRTVVQTRTHAQKYFQKLQKVMKTSDGSVGSASPTGGDSMGMVEMGTASSAKKASPPSAQKKARDGPMGGVGVVGVSVSVSGGTVNVVRRKSGGMAIPNALQSPQQQQQREAQQREAQLRRASAAAAAQSANAAAQAAAQLMAQMATSRPHGVVPAPAPAAAISQPLNSMAASSSPYAADPAQVQQQQQQQQSYQPTQAYSSAPVAAPVDCGQQQQPLQPLNAPDAYGADQYGGGAAATYGAPAATAPVAARSTAMSMSMSITAPAPDQASKRGFFPEPSPAACGKRKLAEIAAAQMLAGVATRQLSQPHQPLPSLPPPPLSAPSQQQQQLSQQQQQQQLPPPAQPSSAKGYIDSLSGTATPPPEGVAMDGNAPPLQRPPSVNGGGFGFGLALQIVNPDTLDDGGEPGGKRRRLVNGQEPSTPWDGELAALVSEVKSKGTEQDLPAFGGLETEIGGPPLLGEIFAAEEPGGGGPPAQPLHPLLETTSRSDLHRAVCTENIETVAVALSISNVEVFVNQCDADGFFPLHSAAAIGITEGGPTADSITNAGEIVQLLLTSGAEACCCDSRGNTPLHWAARAGSDRVCHTLIMRNCPLDAPNESGETALHWAMRAGTNGLEAVRVLLQDGARASAFNNDFRRPLDVTAEGFAHLAHEMAGGAGAATAKGGAAIKAEDGTEADSAVKTLEREQSRANFFLHSPQSRTLVLHHPDCLDHIPKSKHDWECPDRVKCIMDRIQRAANGGQDNTTPNTQVSGGIHPNEVVISADFDRAPLELLSRIHSATYLAFVNDLSKELERRRKQHVAETTAAAAEDPGQSNMDQSPVDPSVVPFTPMVQRTILNASSVKKGAHSDTSFSAGSLSAARRAAGAVQHAVDRVLIGRNRNAFCVVRPPGHHAGVNGLLAGGESCGFCIFNSVAAGAMHALSDESHRPRCERCAVVDIDVHHGNGTEEIVRKCHDPGRLLFFSVHLYDQERKTKKSPEAYKFYPGTGDEDDVAHNIINVPIAPLWREKAAAAKNAAPAPPVESHHNTRQKKKRAAAAAAVPASSNSLASMASDGSNKPSTAASAKDGADCGGGDPSSAIDGSAARPGSSGGGANSPAPPAHYQSGLGRHAYRRAIQQRLLPALRAFNPDLILLSAGFDASRGDVGNARHYAGGRERMGLDLEPEDYAWTTQKIIEIADICCQGRVVSVLEGGYGRTPTVPEVSPDAANSDASKGDGGDSQHLDRTAFSECAVQHLRALIDPAHVLKQPPSSDA